MIEVMNQAIENQYGIYNGDSCEVLKGIPDNSIHFSIFSPPFSNLYVYSNSERDLGNAKSDLEFLDHYKFIISELYRVLMPGRLVAIHVAQIPAMKERDGYIGLKDFRGDNIRAYQDAGFVFHTEVTIWKDPVVEMQRTKSLGLLWKQIKKDSSRNRMGIPDYLIVMLKPGDNPEPITHTPEQFPVDLWQEIASPVWMTVKQGNTLQRESAREHNDERHICPLQLDVIDRAVFMWSNPGDIVLSPFMGIGSEGYQSILMNRKFIGIELKESYYKQAELNLKRASEKEEFLFD